MNTVTKKVALLTTLLVIALIAGCSQQEPAGDGKLTVVTSTAMIADVVRTVAGDLAVVETIIPPGVSPHLYKPTVKDISRLREADLVFYIGLGFEHQLSSLLDTMVDVHAVSFGLAVPHSELIRADTNTFDPHFWMDVKLWTVAADNIHASLLSIDSNNVTTYRNNASRLLDSLMALNQEIIQRTRDVPEDNRELVTTHDCLSYFARAYGFETMAVRDFSGAVPGQPGARAQQVADYVIENGVPALFAEAGMPPDDIGGVQQIVKERAQMQFGPNVISPIYVDNVGKREATGYISMMRHNLNTIVTSLRNRE